MAHPDIIGSRGKGILSLRCIGFLSWIKHFKPDFQPLYCCYRYIQVFLYLSLLLFDLLYTPRKELCITDIFRALRHLRLHFLHKYKPLNKQVCQGLFWNWPSFALLLFSSLSNSAPDMECIWRGSNVVCLSFLQLVFHPVTQDTVLFCNWLKYDTDLFPVREA